MGHPKKDASYIPCDLCDLIRRAAKGCFLFATDVARAYRQLPLDPRDWLLVCFIFEGWFFVDISLTFGLRWAASHCQDATNLVSRELGRRGLSLLNYIDDLGREGGGRLQGRGRVTFCPAPGSHRDLGAAGSPPQGSPLRSLFGWGFNLTP